MKKTKTSEAVEKLLKDNIPSGMTGVPPRDSDKELIIQYLQLHLGMNLNAQQLELLRTVNFESIRRERAKFQEKGMYLGSPEVMAKRKRKAMEVEQTAPTESPHGLQRRIEENV